MNASLSRRVWLLQASSLMTTLEEELQQLSDLETREAAGRLLRLQRLYVSVAKRNPGKGLLCEPPKVRAPPPSLRVLQHRVAFKVFPPFRRLR